MRLTEYISRYPENKWVILIVSCLFICALIRIRRIVSIGKEIYNYIKKERFIVMGDSGILFILPLIMYCLYLAITLPLSYDESFTLKYFTHKGLWHSLTIYPAPNNHVFHTLLTIIPYRLFHFATNPIVLRLPALLFTFLSLALVKTEMGKDQGRFIIFCLLLCFSFGFIEYSFQARGYSIQLFFALWSYILYTRTNQFMELWHLLIFFTVIGLYTSPAYLYFAAPITLMFIVKNTPTQAFKIPIPEGIQRYTPLLLLIACFISFTKYSESKNKGDVHTAFEMQRLTRECDMNRLYVDTNVCWYFKTTYEAYCILNKFSPKYVNEVAHLKQMSPEHYFITTTKQSVSPLDSFSFIIPHYLSKQ